MTEAPEAVRVVIADDHAPMRAGIRSVLTAAGFDVCGEAADARGAVEAVLATRPALALLDINMPGNGITAAGDITASAPDTAVVMLTVARDDAALFDALSAGAAGYLLKDTDPGRLPHALRGVLRGEAALPRPLVARVMDEFRTQPKRRRGRKGDAPPRAELHGGGPMTAADVGAVARTRYLLEATPELCVALVDAAGGDAALVHEALAGMGPHEISPLAGDPDVAEVATRAVARATCRRFTALDKTARRVGLAALALGDRFTVRRAALLSRMPLADAQQLCARLVAERVLDAAPPMGPARLAVAAVVLDEVAGTGLADLRYRTARVLLDERESPEVVAAHLLGASVTGEPWVVGQLEAAADHAATKGDLERAAAFLRRGLLELPPPEWRATLLISLAEVEAARGDAAAVAHYEAALEIVGLPVVRADIRYRLGQALAGVGRLADARDAYDAALRELGDAPDDGDDRGLRAHVRAARASVARLTGGGSGCTDESAVEPALLAEQAVGVVFAGGDAGDAVALARAALAGVLAHDDPSAVGVPTYGPPPPEITPPTTASLSIGNAIAALIWADQLDEADTALDQAEAQARRTGAVADRGVVALRRAQAALARGDVPAAQAWAGRAVECVAGGWRLLAPAVAAWSSAAAFEAGDFEAAEAALALVADRGPDDRNPVHAARLDARGRLLLRRGRPADAVRDFTAAGDLLVRSGIVNPAVVAWRSGAAVALHALGRTDEARALAVEELTLAERTGTPSAVAAATRAVASLAGPDGLALLDAAVESLAGSSARLERARCLAAHGTLLLRAGKRAAGVDRLTEARDLAEQCGAALLRDDIAAELAVSGRRVRTRAAGGVGSLTATERRVAELAAVRLSNKEIASQLFVSVKAVEFHLGNVYAKLAIGSRRELAAALA